MATSRITSKLLRWYRKHGRDLPWRHTNDPYRILISEIMLQQTQVSRVIGFYHSWLKIFPSWKTLANATNAQVIRAWSGLGYNRRALMLRDIARQVVEKGIPKTEEEWRTVKGVGPYTAAALSVFSAHQRTFPIDTNTRRVVGRLFLKQYYPDPNRDGEIRDIAMKELMKSRSFDDIVQALFDLANEPCTKTPTCESCPLRSECSSAQAFFSGKVQVPKRMTKVVNERRHRNKPYPDRIYRGRILKAIQESTAGIMIEQLGSRVDPGFQKTKDFDWLQAMVKRLKKDGMLEVVQGRLQLPL